MNVPIVFACDDNYAMPTGVCIASMMENVSSETRVQAYIFYSPSRLSEESRKNLAERTNRYANLSLAFLDVQDLFSGEFEVRNVSVDTYSRLLIPKRLSHHEIVIYSDMDVVYEHDVADLYRQAEQIFDESSDCVIAALRKDEQAYHERLSTLGITKSTSYMDGCLLVFHTARANALYPQEDYFSHLLGKRFLYQDMDMANILFAGHFGPLSNQWHYAFLSEMAKESVRPKEVASWHYPGPKPWNTFRPFGERWWHYYQLSDFFDPEFYFDYTLRNFRDLNDKLLAARAVKAIPGALPLIKQVARGITRRRQR